MAEGESLENNPSLKEWRQHLDEMFDRMQTLEARKAVDVAFRAPLHLGDQAVKEFLESELGHEVVWPPHPKATESA